MFVFNVVTINLWTWELVLIKAGGRRKLFPPLLRLAGWRGGSPKLVLCCVFPAGVGGREPRLVLLRVSPTGWRPHLWQLLPGLSSQMSVGGFQTQRWRIPLAVCRLQGRWANLELCVSVVTISKCWLWCSTTLNISILLQKGYYGKTLNIRKHLATTISLHTTPVH